MKRRWSLGFKVSVGMFTLGLLALATAAPGCWVILGNDKDYLEIDGGMAGACNNADDVMKLLDPGTDTVNVVKMKAQACGQMCFGNPDPTSCGQNCMMMLLMISEACGLCWGDAIACGIQKCLDSCLIGPMDCDQCMIQSCEPAFHLCAGI